MQHVKKTFPNHPVAWNQHFQLKNIAMENTSSAAVKSWKAAEKVKVMWTLKSWVVCECTCNCSLAHCPNGAFSRDCSSTVLSGMQSPWAASPTPMRWAQKIWHSEKTLFFCLCSFFGPWRGLFRSCLPALICKTESQRRESLVKAEILA